MWAKVHSSLQSLILILLPPQGRDKIISPFLGLFMSSENTNQIPLSATTEYVFITSTLRNKNSFIVLISQFVFVNKNIFVCLNSQGGDKIVLHP